MESKRWLNLCFRHKNISRVHHPWRYIVISQIRTTSMQAENWQMFVSFIQTLILERQIIYWEARQLHTESLQYDDSRWEMEKEEGEEEENYEENHSTHIFLSWFSNLLEDCQWAAGHAEEQLAPRLWCLAAKHGRLTARLFSFPWHHHKHLLRSVNHRQRKAYTQGHKERERERMEDIWLKKTHTCIITLIFYFLSFDGNSKFSTMFVCVLITKCPSNMNSVSQGQFYADNPIRWLVHFHSALLGIQD